MAALEIKERNRPSGEINQLNTVSEGIPALGWVTLVSPSFLLPNFILPYSASCRTATGQQTRTIRRRHEGERSILRESSSQGQQGIVNDFALRTGSLD